MSVSTISKYWEKSSLFFRVLVVFVFMVAIGVSNFIGATLFADDNTEINDSFVSKTIQDKDTDADELTSADASTSNDDTNLILYSID